MSGQTRAAGLSIKPQERVSGGSQAWKAQPLFWCIPVAPCCHQKHALMADLSSQAWIASELANKDELHSSGNSLCWKKKSVKRSKEAVAGVGVGVGDRKRDVKKRAGRHSSNISFRRYCVVCSALSAELEHSYLSYKHSGLSYERSVLSYERSASNYEWCILSYEISVLSYKRSVLSSKCSVLSYEISV